jgi:mRNA degradation ribonuclease J1/J2
MSPLIGRLYDHYEEINGIKFIKLQSGRMMSFWDMMTRADRDFTAFARSMSRCFKLADRDFDLERLEWRIEQQEDYVRSLREEITRLLKTKDQKERIAALRNVTGRTPEEAAAFLAKADELERKLRRSG